ncbi:MAG: hypothetical protein KAY37_01090 [Phycisphaerae bacterium]|nr:hypothetical protein [Phycisphaerae bacterium]
MNNQEILDNLKPAFPVFSAVLQSAWADIRSAISILGPPRRTERANDMHRAVRTNLRRLCDREEVEGYVELVEERDGLGLDYLVWRLGTPLAIRWGRLNNDRVRRNATRRTMDAQGQLMLIDGLEKEIGNFPLVSMVYEIADDHYEANEPCWWIRRIRLVRERTDAVELIAEIAEFANPEQRVVAWKAPKSVVRAREHDVDEWVHIIANAKVG